MKVILWSLLFGILLVGYNNCSKLKNTIEAKTKETCGACERASPETQQEYLIVREYNLKVTGYKIDLSKASTLETDMVLDQRWQISVPNNSTISSTHDLNADGIEDFYVRNIYENSYTFYSGSTGLALGAQKTLPAGSIVIGNYDLTTPEPEYIEITPSEILIKNLQDSSIVHSISFSTNIDFFSANLGPRLEFLEDLDGDQISEVYIKTSEPMGEASGFRITERLLNGRTNEISNTIFIDQYTSSFNTESSSSLIFNPQQRNFIYIKDGKNLLTLSPSGRVEKDLRITENSRSINITINNGLLWNQITTAKNVFLDSHKLVLIGAGGSFITHNLNTSHLNFLNLIANWSYSANYLSFQNEVFRYAHKKYILSHLRVGETERLQLVNIETLEILDIENNVTGATQNGRAQYFIVLNKN